jgi:mannose-6-phosphate isomerase-like protein (cupin superfamily)
VHVPRALRAYHERHCHPNAEEIYYIISGRAAVGAGDREYVAEAGSVQYVAKGAVHWFRNLDDETLDLVGVYVGGSTLDEAGYEYVGPIEDRHRQVS